MPRSTAAGSRYRWYVLALLVLVYTINFVDRIMLGILVPPIKAELGLTDTQLGLLGGTAFALFYTALGIPIGWLADRVNRVWIMTAALALWSAFTAACGLAQNFLHLFLARIGVGIGEAGGTAPSYSLLSDYFGPAERARALGIFSFGIPIGSALGLVLGGALASAIDWRAAFMVVGVAGLLLAPFLRLAVREAPRGGLDTPGAARTAAPALGAVVRLLFAKRSFWGLALAGGSSAMMGYGLLFWLPSFFMRGYGLTLVETSLYYGAITLVGGIAGMWLGGWLADRYGPRNRAAYAMVPAGALLLSAPFHVLGVVSPADSAGYLLFVIPAALGSAWVGPTLCAVQHLVPPGMRTLGSALFLFVNNLIGLGLGALVIGAMSDAFAVRHGADSLRQAILAGTVFYLLGAALFAATSRRLARDWV